MLIRSWALHAVARELRHMHWSKLSALGTSRNTAQARYMWPAGVWTCVTGAIARSSVISFFAM